MTPLEQRLAERTLELVDIPSESRNEKAVRTRLLSLIPAAFEPEYAAEDAFVFARPRRSEVPLVLLVGHYDTVPAQDNVPGRIADGAVHGCGASDMKGGVAVALEIVRELAHAEPGPVDVALLLFGMEELPAQFSPLPDLFERSQLATAADLAILLEPTDLTIQAGCLGNMNAQITFTGTSGHSARPWLADNAIAKAIGGLAGIAALERREAIVGGLPFYEVASITRIEGGIADNVIPDRVTVTLNFRYAPDRTPASAAEYLARLTPDGAELEITGDSPPASVVTDSALVTGLREAGNLTIEPKQAWTNVADFTTRGIDAINFGPGATRYAHRRDELVEIPALASAYETLLRFLMS